MLTDEFNCEVREVFSGDDLIIYIDLGVENLLKRQRVRLAGVDTPPAINASGDTEAGQIRGYVRALTKGKKSRIVVLARNANSWVCQLFVHAPEGEVCINELLIARGYKFEKKGATNVQPS
jgi:hypothetical protein